MGYGTTGGTRAVEQLRLVLAELRVATVRTSVHLSLFTDFREFREFTPGAHQLGTLEQTLDQVVAWSSALAPLRLRAVAA